MKVSPLTFDRRANYKASIYNGSSGDGYVSRGDIVKSGVPIILTDLTATTAERVLRERTEALNEYYFRASFRLDDVRGILREGAFVEITHVRHHTLFKFVSIPEGERHMFTVSYILKTAPMEGVLDVVLTLRSG